MSVSRLVAAVNVLRPSKVSDLKTAPERSRERYRRAAITTMASVGAQAVATLATVVSVPLALSYLGAERYGLWMSVTSLVAVIAAADLGVGNGLLNAIAEAHGRDDRELAGRYVSSAFFLLTLVALLLAAATLAVQPLLSWPTLLNANSSLTANEAQPTALAVLACSFALIPLGIAARIHLGYQEGFINSMWQTVGSILGMLGLFLAVLLRWSLPWLVLAFSLGPVISAGLNLVVLLRDRSWLRPRWQAVRRAAANRFLRTGVQFAILQGVFAIAFLSDNVVIARIFGPNAVAQYAVHAQLFGFAPLLAGLALGPFWPAYGESIARGDIEWVRKALFRSVIATTILVGGASLVLLSVGDPLMHLWVGSRIEPSFPLMLGLGAWAVVSSVGNAVAMFLNGTGALRLQVGLACLMCPAALVGKFIGAETMGLPGIIIGTLIAYLVFTAAPLALFLPRIVHQLELQMAHRGNHS